MPQLKPIRMADTHLLAYALVEYLDNSSQQSPIPRRMVQRELTVSDGKRLSSRLKSLVDQGWLVQHKSQLIGRSATYEPGPQLTNNPSLEKAWLEFANSVHGVHGLLKDLRHRPARAHGHLNTNGVLILAALSNTTIPIRVKELEIYFQSLMSPKTVKSYLKKLVSKGLIAKDSKGYSLVSDFEAQLNSYETIETTCAQRKQRITITTHSETRTFHQQQNPDGILSERSKRTWRWGYTDTSNATIVGCRG
jgi:DNA-binding HxlR family transcriptional regulator